MKCFFPRLLMPSVLVFAGALISFAAPPGWWNSGNPPVIDPAATVNNKAPANVGQAKWMAKKALDALREVNPECAEEIEADLVGPDKIIPGWNAPGTDEQKEGQYAPLLLGQLKAISAPFYDHLHSLAPDWLANERVLNGTSNSGTHYPWTTTQADDANRAVANIGQLKAVFSLRFEMLPSVQGGYEEWIIAQFGEGTTTGPEDDPDGDGVSNLEEFQNGLIPYQEDSDGDGYGDYLSVKRELHLKFDEVSGLEAHDASGLARHGFLVPSPSWEPHEGIENGTLRFGGSTERLSIPAVVLNGKPDLTISFWFKTSNSSAAQTLLSGISSSQVNECAVDLEGETSIRFHTGAGNSVVWNAGRGLANGLWHHVILVRDVSAGAVSLYLDGALHGTSQAVALQPLNISGLVLGQRHQTESSFDSTTAYSGLVDDLRVYSAVLELTGTSGAFQSGYAAELFQPNDLDHDGLPDDWERSFAGNLAALSAGEEDLDGDGDTNREELLNDTDPTGYFNGEPPVITVISGNGQTVYSGSSTPVPIVFQVTGGGVPLANVPVQVSHLERIGLLKPVQGGRFSSSSTLKTNAQGKISLIFKAN